MEPEKEKLLRDYAWAYFSFHADQRMKTFNFFIILAGLISGGVVTLMRDNGSPCIVALLGIALSILCLLFWRLDHRNHVLIHNGLAAIRFLDSQRGLPTSDGGIPHVLDIIARDDYISDRQSHSLFRKGHFSYSQVIKYVYGLFACLGIIFAFAPFFIVKSTPVQPVNSLAPTAPTAPASVSPDSAQLVSSDGGCKISNLVHLAVVHSTDPKTLNTIGLLLNILGVCVLFYYGFPQPSHDDSVCLAVPDATRMPGGGTAVDHKEKVRKLKSQYRRRSIGALSLILLGFGFQVWAAWK